MRQKINFFDRVGVFAIALGGIILVLALLGDPARASLRWTSSALHDGEWWRIITGHLVHLDLTHALLNVAVLILLAALFGQTFTLTRHAVHAGVGVLVIDASLTWLTYLEWYVGLSGVLHTLAAAAVVRLIIDDRDRVAWGVALFGLAKVVFENISGALPFSGDEGRVITDAHLFGVLTGMMLGLIPAAHRPGQRIIDPA